MCSGLTSSFASDESSFGAGSQKSDISSPACTLNAPSRVQQTVLLRATELQSTSVRSLAEEDKVHAVVVILPNITSLTEAEISVCVFVAF